MGITGKKSLKAIDILTDSVRIFARNPNFILFTALTSLPLFLFSLYLQTVTRSFFIGASYLIEEQAGWFRSLISNLSSDQLRELFRLSVLYFAPLNLLILLAAIPTVNLGSKLHRDGNQRCLTLMEMYKISSELSGERVKGILVTFTYVVSFSTCTLLGFGFLLSTRSSVMSYTTYYHHYSFVSPLRSDLCFHLLHGSNLVLLLGIYLAWGAIWNTGLVVSVIEEGRHGARALGAAGFLCLRNVHCGMVLMLGFSAVEVISRAPWGFEGWAVVVAQSGALVLGNAVKWVGFVVYIDGCVDRLFVKKQDVHDVEQG